MKKRVVKLLAALLLLVTCFSEIQPYMAYEEGEPVKVGVYELEGFHSFNEDGTVSGYGIDYLNVVAGITGWEYEFVPVTDFMDGCRKLDNKEIDLLAPVMLTDDRKEKYDYSDMSFGTEYSVLLTREGNEDVYFDDYETFNQMKVAVVEGYPFTEYFITYMETHGFESELVYYNNTAESHEALRNGEVDAMVTSIMDMRSDEKMLARFTPQPFYFMTYKNNYEFLGQLNDAMIRISNIYPTLIDDLLLEYYPVYEFQYFTREEVAYVESARTLRVAYVSDRKPLSFTDENGEFNGISREIFDQIAEISGLKFEYIELPQGEISYEYLQEQKIDLITGVEYNSANMNSKGILLSRPYISARKVMVSRPDFVYEPEGNYKIAVVLGSKTLQSVLKNQYPSFEIVEYMTMDECFEALYTGEVDMLIQNQYVVEAMLSKPVYSTMVVVPIDGLNDELCFSTVVSLNGNYGMSEHESSLLIDVLNKTISQIDEDELDNIIMRETVEHQYEVTIVDFLYNYRFTIATIVFVLLILIVVAILYMKERRKRERLIEEETQRNNLLQKRYKAIIESTDELIYEISLMGEASIGSERIKEKFGWEIPSDVGELDFAKAMEILHVHPDDEQIFRQSQLAQKGEFDDLTLRICKADGSAIWCRISRTILMDGNNNVVSILGKIVDVDDEVKEKKRLEHRSRTDSLTGLLNKQTYEKEVRDYVEKNSTQNSCFVFIDMDHFKEINDTFGHSIGDQVIKEVAKKIQLLFANFDLVGRFGGDEFCVFVKEIPRDTLIDKLRFAVKKMEQEYSYEGGVVKISASIGAAYCKRDGVGYKELLDVADEAAYQAKDNGRNCYIIKDIE